MNKLSIITINFNNKDGLKKTMESVVQQTFTDFEYVIIDGASTDGSVGLIEELVSTFQKSELAKPAIKWISEPDNGIYHAMNKGIKMATGEYVQFINSGDFLTNSDIIKKFTASINHNTGIIYGNMIKLFPKKKLCDRGFAGRTPTMLDFYKGTLNHSPALIKRELFSKYGYYDESLKLVSDWKWYMNTIIFGNEVPKYVNLDIIYFDMDGVSTLNQNACHTERQKVLKEIIPASILADYKKYSSPIIKWNRLQKYKLSSMLVWITERILFKLELLKIKTTNKTL